MHLNDVKGPTDDHQEPGWGNVDFARLTFLAKRDILRVFEPHRPVPFEDLKNAILIDEGILSFFRVLFSRGPGAAFEHFRIVSPAIIAQAYMNLMLFVPMGYLLPYVFGWFRARAVIRPAVACFLISVATENMQLIFRRGLYDLDDILANTLGGFIGQMLFLSVAYVVTHPVWRKNLKAYHSWSAGVRSHTLYPFRKSVAVSRTVLRASDADAVMDFYSGKLGYRMVARLRDPDSGKQTVLLQLGRSQAEFRCDPDAPVPEGQELVFTASKIPSILKRLRMNGIDVRTDYEDPCTDRRALVFGGPDQVKITILEEI
jgi:catechol 2,3-dioxygenase-like lactoylglutathione lyase family enzyme